MFKQWDGFKDGTWQEGIDVRNFIQKNYKLYEGDSSFLEDKTEKTDKVWKKAYELIVEEVKKGIIDVATDVVSGIDNYSPGYIDKDNEVIVGLQTDAPLKRIVNPFGGFRMVQSSLKEYGYKLDENIEKYFPQYRKTHNEGVFDAYTKEIRAARSAGLLTGLPDAYGRGRIIGDYRRVALYGIDYLIEEKKIDLDNLNGDMLDELVRKREEVNEQIRALSAIKSMAARYGVDISKPAENAKEAVQALYFGYLAGIKENNGAATSFGRTSTFLDIYIERDLDAGLITEKEAQELVDQLIIKLRLVRHLRTPEYNELFGGDPTWVTESIGGMGINGKSLVTKNSYRYLHTLINLGTSAEPNLTVLWSDKLPENFKKYCAEISIKTDAIQYESDEVMRPVYGDDYAIACCVSAMKVGKQMQFFGARANIAKSLLYAINGGVDELKGIKVVPGIPKLTDEEILDFKKVKANYDKVMEYVAKVYVDTMNIIHCMHDKYAYEAGQMALHDTSVERLMAFGIAGLSVAIDSLSAIKHAKVRPIRNEDGIAIDFEVEGEFPKYGNDDDRADDLGVALVTKFSNELKKHPLYRNAKHTLSALTITSNVMYGKK
ncbi:MAG TPA: formate C-acetyltransferase, partial [Clostridium sp.]